MFSAKRLSVLCLTAGVAACIGYLSPWRTTSVGATIMQEYPVQTQLFSVLGRPATPADAQLVPAARGLGHALLNHDVEGQPDLVRTIYSDDTLQAGVFPTSTGVCLIVVRQDGGGPSGGCVTNESAAASGLVLGFTNSQGNHVVGLIPDGWQRAISITVRGNQNQAAANAQGGFVFTSDAPPSSIAFTHSDGSRHEVALPGLQGSASIIGG